MSHWAVWTLFCFNSKLQSPRCRNSGCEKNARVSHVRNVSSPSPPNLTVVVGKGSKVVSPRQESCFCPCLPSHSQVVYLDGKLLISGVALGGRQACNPRAVQVTSR